MKINRQYAKALFLALLFNASILIVTSCSDDNEVTSIIEEDAVDDSDFEATDWTTQTHSKAGDPDFDEVFEDNAVKRLDIVITEARWQSMLDNMTNLYGAFGATGQGGPPGGGTLGGSITTEKSDFCPGRSFLSR
ncbi:hypothetical protein [Bizionia gelidisalsuginis]|uniref:hypothetical protein n=1 Tax=Bizionia gelidisalsuginis TaxID=291188 RepID=UPI001FE33D4C|nr:hypothetical protein [Bizionia gelidisalsuginis]